MEFIFVYVTCESRTEAVNVGKAVVESRLTACANIIDGMESVYWWNDQLQVETVIFLFFISIGHVSNKSYFLCLFFCYFSSCEKSGFL